MENIRSPTIQNTLFPNCSFKHVFVFFSPLTHTHVIYTEGGDTLEQVAQGACGCPMPGGIQGQAGCGSGQPGLVVGDPEHSRVLKLDNHCGPFQPRPFYDSLMIQRRQETTRIRGFAILEDLFVLRHSTTFPCHSS